MRLLLINPNTSAHITARLAASARPAMRPGDTLTAVTARSGPAIVRSAEQLREAEASALALARDHAADHDAIVLGISLDGVASPLRARHPGMAVVGMIEAALMTACLRADRVGLLTIGSAMLPLYRERVGQIGVAARVVGYEAPELPEVFAARAEQLALTVPEPLLAAAHRLRDAGARVIVLAGAALCGYAAPLAARLGLPVLDGVACAVGQARVLVDHGCWLGG